MKGLLNTVLNNNKVNKIKKNNENLISINEKLKIPYPLKTSYNIIIPTNIYQTWHTKLLPPLMANSVKLIKSTNELS